MKKTNPRKKRKLPTVAFIINTYTYTFKSRLFEQIFKAPVIKRRRCNLQFKVSER